jgi:hypothetical protein
MDKLCLAAVALALHSYNQFGWDTRQRHMLDSYNFLLVLQVEPKDRLGAGAGGVRDIMAHPWFADFDWEALKAGTMKV